MAIKENHNSHEIMLEHLFVYGTGGHGREIASFLSLYKGSNHDTKLLGFIDDNKDTCSPTVDGLRVYSYEESINLTVCGQRSVVCAIGNPKIRASLVSKCSNNEFNFPIYNFSNFINSSENKIGAGTIIFPGVILTCNIEIGNHVHINLGSTISHDVIVGNFVTINPGVVICGWVHIEDGVYIGAGATISNGNPRRPLILGSDSVIGAGACVIKSVLPQKIVVGVPAKEISR